MTDEADFYQLNANQLDIEWLRQPRLYHHYAAQLADARRELEEVKASVEVAHAEASRAVRDNPSLHGVVIEDGKKPTEGAIAIAVSLNKTYRKAQHDEINARHRVELLQATVTTLDHRKKALEKLVDLRLANYFSDPRPSEIAAGTTDKWKTNRAFQTDKKRKDSLPTGKDS